MQNTGDLSLDIYTIFREEELDDISLDLKRGDRIFFI